MEGRPLRTALLLGLLICASPSLAQQANAPKSDTSSGYSVLIPGAMKGFGTMGPTGYRRLCAPLSVGLYEWRMQWVERFVKPTDAQRARLNDLVAASTNLNAPHVGRTMEKRVAGMLEALKIIRPAYENFYGSLDRRQKAFLDALGPGRHGWRL